MYSPEFHVRRGAARARRHEGAFRQDGETSYRRGQAVSDNASFTADHAVPPAADLSFVGRLAQFFPAATPVRLPVSVTAEPGLSEQTVIEYGTPREVLFASGLPLEFGERVRLRNVDGSLDAEALVVALQLHGGHTAVAARFTREISNWIVKP